MMSVMAYKMPVQRLVLSGHEMLSYIDSGLIWVCHLHGEPSQIVLDLTAFSLLTSGTQRRAHKESDSPRVQYSSHKTQVPESRSVSHPVFATGHNINTQCLIALQTACGIIGS